MREPKPCWFCRRPVLIGERANRAPHGDLTVHTDCLQADAVNEGARPDAEARLADPIFGRDSLALTSLRRRT